VLSNLSRRLTRTSVSSSTVARNPLWPGHTRTASTPAASTATQIRNLATTLTRVGRKEQRPNNFRRQPNPGYFRSTKLCANWTLSCANAPATTTSTCKREACSHSQKTDQKMTRLAMLGPQYLTYSFILFLKNYQ
jgi:hypothetical protein